MSDIRYRLLTEQLRADRERTESARCDMREAARAWSAWRVAEDARNEAYYTEAEQDLGDGPDDALDAAAHAASEQPADVRHTEAPPQPGVYAMMDYSREQYKRANKWCAWWDGEAWHRIAYQHDAIAIEIARRNGLEESPVSWLHLISADTPAIPDWRPGDQVPEGERTGLWHYRCPKHGGFAGSARSADYFIWAEGLGQFRPAAPGVREGEAYDEARYGVAG